ncbi:hypothetical protein A9K55_005357 [Cordyceps militaris]|uniref:Velvet domain-containing protein n=1 Tax=Cordyceps militaris TaxID=73501 RepID=A0A2H4SPF0_CORMI|nr:hypothetical protein A9K55_005357 [Cordyceps militaris]
MSARVTYFLWDHSALNHHQHNDLHQHASPSSSSSSAMANVTIAVHPPCRAQTRTLLSPPVVVELSGQKCSSDIPFFATAVLLHPASGAVAEGLLEGTTAATGVLLSASSIVFAFPDLSVAAAGTYTMRLDVYAMYPDSTEGATLIAQLETTQIAVLDEPVASQRPSSTEENMMQLIRDAGVPLSPPH